MLIGTSALGLVLFPIVGVKQVLQQRSIFVVGTRKGLSAATALGRGWWLVCLEVVAEVVAKVAAISRKLEFWPELFPLLKIFSRLNYARTHTLTQRYSFTHTHRYSLTHIHTHTTTHTHTHLTPPPTPTPTHAPTRRLCNLLQQRANV